MQTYKYDAVNRLTEAREANNGQRTWQQNWTYDRFGNRLSHVKFIGDTQIVLDNKTNPTIDPNTNRFTAGQGYQYDLDGNIIQDADNRQFTFNGDNKQTQVKDAGNNVIGTYFYDGGGKRIKKVTNLETTIFVYSGGKLVAEYSTQINPTPQSSYLTSDTLGSPRVITDQYGNVTSRRDFMPFGEELYADPIYRKTNFKYGGTDTIRQKFTGYQKDEETNLDFAEARYYNSAHGRFTAVDPLLASGKSSDPQTFNRYVYVMNNPLIATDPSGMRPVYYHKNKDGTTSLSETYQKGWTLYTGGEQTLTTTNGDRIVVNSNGITNLGNAATLDRINRFAAGIMQAASDTAFGGGGTAYNGLATLVNGSNWLANRLQNFRGYREDQFNYLPYYEPGTPGEQSAAMATGILLMASGGFTSGAGVASSTTLATTPNRIFSTRVLLRSAEETGPMHNFPLSFNETIFTKGTRTVTPNFYNKSHFGVTNDSILYKLPGEINGHPGVFEIGVRPTYSGNTELIWHRFFKPK